MSNPKGEELRKQFELIHFGIDWNNGKLKVHAWDFGKFDKWLELSNRDGLKFAFKRSVYIPKTKFNSFELTKVIDTEIMVFTTDFKVDWDLAKMKFLESMQQAFVNGIINTEKNLVERREILAVMESMTGKKFEYQDKFSKMVKNETIYTM